MAIVAAEISVFLFGSNNLAREGLRRILEEENFKVWVSDDNALILPDWERQRAAKNLIIIDTGILGNVERDVALLHGRYPDAHIVVLADSFDFDSMMQAFQSGADGYIVKEIGCEPLVESLRLVAMGEKVMPSALAHFLPGRIETGRRPVAAEFKLTHVLSDREIETFRRMCRGEPNKIIAQNLGISEATVKVHVKAILRKLGLRNRTQAVALALNSGFDADSDAVATQEAEVRKPAASSQNLRPAHKNTIPGYGRRATDVVGMAINDGTTLGDAAAE